jgi:regulator of replication initiation timing
MDERLNDLKCYHQSLISRTVSEWETHPNDDQMVVGFALEHIAELEASQKPPTGTWAEAYGIQADQIIKLNRENSELKLQNERMREALEEFASQKFISDMTTEEMIDADFHGAYDQFILVAKAVLKTLEAGA